MKMKKKKKNEKKEEEEKKKKKKKQKKKNKEEKEKIKPRYFNYTVRSPVTADWAILRKKTSMNIY